ncbi:MAG: hypothetical protein KGJ80_06715 [Chloroflexota bacterium]|nr:hypothetical protein [Chloroflexota bacterium]
MALVENVTSRDRWVMAVVAVIAGILMLTVAPNIFIGAMDTVLKGIAVKLPTIPNPDLKAAPQIVTLFFPLWGALGMIAGATLLAITLPLYRGERWARAVAIGMAAIPAIAGAYLSGPIVYFAKNAMPLFLVLMTIGLVPYFVLLLWGRASAGEKVGDFFLFLALGVTAAWSFSNAGSSLRILMSRTDFSALYVFLLGVPVAMIGVIAVIVGIPFLAARTRAGWWLSLVGLLGVTLGNILLYLSGLTSPEFLLGIILGVVFGVVSLALLLMPGIGGATHQRRSY